MSYTRSDLSEIKSDVPSKKKDSFDLDEDDEKEEEIVDGNTTDPSASPQKWADFTKAQKLKTVLIAIGKGIALTCAMFFFICSLDLLSCGFRLIGGRPTGNLFKNNKLLSNAVVGVMIGLLVTVAVQSSSTTTTILVGLVSAGIMTVKVAIPFVFGANIGTSITNAIVSLGQIGDRHQFKLAFAGACLHDAFNFLSVVVLLIVEVTTDYLYELTKLIVESTQRSYKGKNVELLSYFTKPLVNQIVRLDSKQLINIANSTGDSSKSLIKSSAVFPLSWGDATIGSIVLVVAIVALFTCLLITVKILKSILQGQLAKIVKRTVNANIPYVPWLAGYIAICVGALMTFLLQSSSVFTSAMTPLIGMGVISIDRAYPLTLGSNVGTCITAIIASLAVQGPSFYPAFQIALCHLFFNLTGILLFYPIPFMRLPVGIAKFIGRETSKYRWFALAYMLMVFFVFPFVILGISLAGAEYVIAFTLIFFLVCFIIIIINVLQGRKPNWLPKVLRTWEWLPLGLRSLRPYDDFFGRFNICKGKTASREKIVDTLHGDSQSSIHEPIIDTTDQQRGENYNAPVESGDTHNVVSQVEIVNEKTENIQPK